MKPKENPFRKPVSEAESNPEVKLEWPKWATHYCERCKNFVVSNVAGNGNNFNPIIGGSVGSTLGSILVSSALNSLTRGEAVHFCPTCKNTNMKLHPKYIPRDPRAKYERPKNFIPKKRPTKQ